MLNRYTPIIKLLSKTIKQPFSIMNYNYISNFTLEQTQLQDQVKRFCDEKIAKLADYVDRDGAFPNEIWKVLGQQGYLGVSIKGKYGGSDMNYTAHTIIVEELSRASGSIGLSYGAHTALCMGQIDRHGTEDQKLKYLPSLCNGDHIGALAMSEPNAGSDVVSMKTKAVKRGRNYYLTGTKMWITNGPDADTMVVYAKTEPEAESKGITAFIVEKNFKGFKVGKKIDKLGMRGSNTSEIIFDECEVPEENVLGEVNKGVYVLMGGLDYERLLLSAGPVGIMQSAFEYTLKYVCERKQFKQPVGTFQLMQGKIADMFVKLQSSRAMLYSLARACDENNISNADCAALILYVSTCGTEVCMEAIQALGGNGYTNEYPVGRMMRDAKLYEIGAGTNEIRRWLIGRELVKTQIPKYKK